MQVLLQLIPPFFDNITFIDLILPNKLIIGKCYQLAVLHYPKNGVYTKDFKPSKPGKKTIHKLKIPKAHCQAQGQGYIRFFKQ